ncbi:hypothetical protein RND71_012392 [Anisodus tanguticus]|uniref:Uncharacterized protein n=1 Tax=Anisodus tanguticus TaxID=243964 RepID=A0AAE1SF35_9SOLA|nr:hypothetical protein RND71_012392 [Anisodus tanguticus]
MDFLWRLKVATNGSLQRTDYFLGLCPRLVSSEMLDESLYITLILCARKGIIRKVSLFDKMSKEPNKFLARHEVELPSQEPHTSVRQVCEEGHPDAQNISHSSRIWGIIGLEGCNLKEHRVGDKERYRGAGNGMNKRAPDEPVGNRHHGGDNFNSGSLVHSIGRDNFINCLIHCSRSDYSALTSFGRSFCTLNRSGDLYRLWRQNSAIDHWVYFSCQTLEWEAFDLSFLRWMHLSTMNPVGFTMTTIGH